MYMSVKLLFQCYTYGFTYGGVRWAIIYTMFLLWNDPTCLKAAALLSQAVEQQKGVCSQLKRGMHKQPPLCPVRTQ